MMRGYERSKKGCSNLSDSKQAENMLLIYSHSSENVISPHCIRSMPAARNTELFVNQPSRGVRPLLEDMSTSNGETWPLESVGYYVDLWNQRFIST